MTFEPGGGEVPTCRMPGCEKIIVDADLFLCDVHTDEARHVVCTMCGSVELKILFGWLEGRIRIGCPDCKWSQWLTMEGLF